MTPTQIEIMMRDIYRVQGYVKPKPTKDAKEQVKSEVRK